MVVKKNLYWEKLVDHYYENVHWSESDIQPKTTITSWLRKEYDADVGLASDTIFFNNSKKYTWFMLRWS